jgi:transcription initiation factor TFIIA large subunit
MSNTPVGNVYQQIIADVVESSRVDFEEGGVDEGVLEELRLVRLLSFLVLLFLSVVSNTSLVHRLHINMSIPRCLRVLSSVGDMSVDDSSFGCDGLLPGCAVAPASIFCGWAPLCIWLYTQPFACKIQPGR